MTIDIDEEPLNPFGFCELKEQEHEESTEENLATIPNNN